MTPPEDVVRLRHLRDAAEKAIAYTGGRTRRDLDEDELLRLALTKLVEIVGEAAKQVSSATQAEHRVGRRFRNAFRVQANVASRQEARRRAQSLIGRSQLSVRNHRGDRQVAQPVDRTSRDERRVGVRTGRVRVQRTGRIRDRDLH